MPDVDTRAADIRVLRVHLAEALADAADDRGQSAIQEATDQLERALAEPGGVPTEAEIQLRIAQLIEGTDPAGALHRYLLCLGNDPHNQRAAAKARIVLATMADAALAVLPAEDLRAAVDAARQGDNPNAALLATGLLRAHGREADALPLLEAVNAGSAMWEEAVHLRVELLLDLDRVQEALDIIESDVREERSPTMCALHLRAHLLRGQFGEVVRDAYRFGKDARHRELCGEAGLALLGLGCLDEALIVMKQSAGPNAVRVMILLAQRDYAAARDEAWALLRASPQDSDAQMLSAQVALESVGHDTTGGGASLDELDSARQRLDDTVEELSRARRPASWRQRVQELARGSDGRYQFFRAELKAARHEEITVDEIDAVDRSTTTYLQDAALAERKGSLLEQAGELGKAADAYADAADIFWTQQATSTSAAADYRRAFHDAQASYRLAPTPSRAADQLLLAASVASVDQQADDRVGLIEHAAAAATESLSGAADDEVPELLRAFAWAYHMLSELQRGDAQAASRAVTWGLAAGIANPRDVDVHLNLASRLADINASAGALSVARYAYSLDAQSQNVVDAVIMATANYSSEFADVQSLLAQAEELVDIGPEGGDRSQAAVEARWYKSVALHVRLSAGDRDAIKKLLAEPLSEEPWALHDRAVAAALLKGIPAAQEHLSNALKANVGVDDLSAAFLSLLLRREDTAEARLQEAVGQGSDKRGIERARLDMEFFRDAIPRQDYVRRCFASIRSPAEKDWFVNVTLPLLAAARSVDSDPQVRPVNPVVVTEQIPRFVQPGRDWPQELDSADVMLLSLARLWTASVLEPSRQTARAAAVELRNLSTREAIAPLLPAVADSAERHTFSEVAKLLVRDIVDLGSGATSRALADGLGTGDEPTAERLALGLLVPQAETVMLADQERKEDVEHCAAMDVVAAAREVVTAAGQWWRLYDRLQAIPAADTRSQRVAATAQSELMTLLGEFLNVNSSSDVIHSDLSLRIGSDFVPEDSGSDWVLFRELIPQLRERVAADTGFDVPGVLVREDPNYTDTLRILLSNKQYEVRRLPTGGVVRPARPSEHPDFVDPLTGQPVVVDTAAGGRSETHWTPLEFLVRHVESFVRAHIADLMDADDVTRYANLAGERITGHVFSDAAAYTRWLAALREAARDGELRDPIAAALLIAEKSGVDSQTVESP